MKKISVIIPTYNAEKTVKQCVESVLQNDYGNFEVIVIDGNSTDGTQNVLKSISIKDKRLKIYVNEINSGASFSRNFGIKKSEGEIKILLDSDSYVPADWIRKHVELHEKIDADIIGGGIVGVHKTAFGKADSFCNWWTSIPFSKDYFLKKLHLPTNNLSMKNSVFKKIGYLNESLRIGGEDAEFCFRAMKNNLKIYFKLDLIVYHHDRDYLDAFVKHQENWGKHAVNMRKKLNMDYSFLMPKSYLMSFLYIMPLAVLYTAFIVSKWVKYQPSVLVYSPIIFYGKLRQTIAIKDSFKQKPH